MKREENQERKVISGAVYLTISTLIVKIIGLIYKIPLSYILTDEGMSYFNSAYTIYTFFYIICTAGIPKSISIITSEFIARGKNKEARRITETALIYLSLFGLIVSLVFLLLSNIISKAIGNSGAHLSMLAVAPSIAFICASGVLRGYFNGRFSFIPIAVSEVVTAASRLIFGIGGAIFASNLGTGFDVISAVTISGATIGAVISYVFLFLYDKKQISNENLIEYKKLEKFLNTI